MDIRKCINTTVPDSTGSMPDNFKATSEEEKILDAIIRCTIRNMVELRK